MWHRIAKKLQPLKDAFGFMMDGHDNELALGQILYICPEICGYVGYFVACEVKGDDNDGGLVAEVKAPLEMSSSKDTIEGQRRRFGDDDDSSALNMVMWSLEWSRAVARQAKLCGLPRQVCQLRAQGP